jgi:hypothetical protein
MRSETYEASRSGTTESSPNAGGAGGGCHGFFIVLDGQRDGESAVQTSIDNCINGFARLRTSAVSRSSSRHATPGSAARPMGTPKLAIASAAEPTPFLLSRLDYPRHRHRLWLWDDPAVMCGQLMKQAHRGRHDETYFLKA